MTTSLDLQTTRDECIQLRSCGLFAPVTLTLIRWPWHTNLA